MLVCGLLITTSLHSQNVGIGITNPQEILHLGGAAILGQHAQPAGAEVAGTIEWDASTSAFRGFNGTSWVQLDIQFGADNDWIVQTNPFGTPELVPVQPPSTLSMGLAGSPNSGGFVWIPDIAAPNLTPHLLMLESTQNQPGIPGFDASMLFTLSDWITIPSSPVSLFDFSLGILASDQTFKLTNTATLTTSSQGDGTTMIRSHPSGIIDLPNNSRVRATVSTIDWSNWQLVQPNVWTPVNFTNDGAPGVPGPTQWDTQNEFTVASSPNQPVPPPNSFFTATEEGYYQVNARCEFETDEYWEGGSNPVYMHQNSYVSIAVWINTGSGWASHSIGNNLQTTNNIIISPPPPGFEDATETLTNNNAPNVSDVIYLQATWQIAIYVFHWSLTPMNLRVGDNILYVSIIKTS